MFFRKFKKLYTYKVSSLGLALFRVAYGLVLLGELNELFYFRNLVFDQIPYIEASELELSAWIFLLWMLVIGGLIVGFQTSKMALMNYLLGLFTFSSLSDFEYHVFYIYTHVNFLCLFLPIGKSLSLDHYLEQRKNKETGQKTDTNIRILYYYVPIFTCLGLLYLDSIVYKISSGGIWLRGLGFWLPSSLPMIVYKDWSVVLNWGFLSIGLGYAILIFETVFIFLIWYRSLRWFLGLTGIFLHLGILFVYPIPYFSLMMLCLYLLVIPGLTGKRGKQAKLSTLPENKPIENQGVEKSTDFAEKPVFQIYRVRIFRTHLLYFFVCYCCVAQAFWLQDKVLSSSFTKKLGLYPVFQYINTPVSTFNSLNQFFLGIRSHTVFLDGHFNHYNHIIAIVYQAQGREIWLPMINPKGQAVGYNRGFVWSNWTFSVNTPQIDPAQLKKGIKRYTAFWAHKNQVDLDRAVFIIKLKEIEVPDKWEKDFLKKQMQKPWINMGKAQWINKRCMVSLPDSLQGL